MDERDADVGAHGPHARGEVPDDSVAADGADGATVAVRGVHAAALASLPSVGARRLDRLIGEREPEEAWENVRRGAVSSEVADVSMRAAWRAHAASVDLRHLQRLLESLDVWVTTARSPGHPPQLCADIDPAPVIFRRGRPIDSAQPAVAIVGTRRCTPTGRSLAMELGAGLAEAGLTVVSGLALGIDGAAHRGALAVSAGRVVGVVGSGLDVVYPRGNRDLWKAVAQSGTLLSEAPMGAAPEPWRFPARNRLLAALCEVVVVVESNITGGSMHTVEEALRRGVAVMAVPGSVRNPAAAGTNALLSEGCAPACSVDDVLVAVSLATATATPETRAREARPTRRAARHGVREPSVGDHAEVVPVPAATVRSDAGAPRDLDPLEQRVLAALDDSPISLDRLVLRVQAPAPQVLAVADRLESLGLLARQEGLVMRG